ncbi:MAG: glycosyltransferase family 4 protein [Flavobacteriaceae bacterium]|nr:glycosyltransferase family 4 protein [Flavobacteriaceae bacterium]
MKKRTIAIYSGTIPTTTFIENLINGISKTETVYLFGKKRRNISYKSYNVKQFPVFNNSFINILVTFFRLLQLLFYPKRIFILFKELNKFNDFSERLNWLIRYVPVLLHLPSVFHVQWAKDVKYWFFLQEELDIPIALSLRGAHVNYSPIIDKNLAKEYSFYFPKIRTFHAVSSAIALEAEKYGASPKSIKVLHSPISEKVFNQYKNTSVNRSEPEYKILSVGRHHWKKGYEDAIKVMSLLKGRGFKFTYDIIASGKVSEELIYLKNQYNLEEVNFLNGLEQEQLFTKMQQYDILLLPSIEEGIANVVLEAMAIGLPVITTDCGGMKEVINDEENGWIVSVGDIEKMAETIQQVSELPKEKLSLVKKKAHETIEEQFHEEKVIPQFIEWYYKIS